MKGKSVIFIEPRSGSGNVFENYMRLPLLGTLYLGTILHEHGYQVRILSENITWAAQVRTDLAKQPQTVELMVKAGCRWLYVGFESIDDVTLARQ